MTQRILSIFVLVMGIFVAVTLFGEENALSLTPAPTTTPAPAATSTTTPNPAVPPAAPSGLVKTPGGVLLWTDNSDNEEGFIIKAAVCGHPFQFTVGPNTTSFQLPPEVLEIGRTGAEREPCGLVLYTVQAYNAAGTSQPAADAKIVDGDVPAATPFAIPAAGSGLPSSAEGPSLASLLALAVTGSVLLAMGGVGQLMRGRI